MTNPVLLKANAAQVSNGAGGERKVESLSARHAADCQKTDEGSQVEAWRLWLREVEVNPMYRNRIDTM